MPSQRPVVYISADPENTGDAIYTLNRVILQLGAWPVQTYFSKKSGDYDWTLVRKAIDECDVYILLVGDGYGTQSESGESYIHREAVYAKSKQKTIVALLKNTELKHLSQQGIERLRSLHRLMMSGVFKYWNGQEELLLVARQVLREHLKPQIKVAVTDEATIPQVKEAIVDTLMDMQSYPIRFSAKVFAHGNCHEIAKQISLTWESTYVNLASVMTAPVTEERMRSILEDFVAEYYRDDFMVAVPDAHALADVRCNDIEFQRLKAFLKGAGVIENVASEQSGLRNYWQLTQAGESKLHKMLLPR
ncbi:DUF4062 domain-containing protein [Bermanella marisrubri]|uniref:DUF4062 domain-containing protein n=1 Tax=Bermanella marisrubri TaxID=207949 RepID=Q1N4Y8_9GAMM|nr:DUF4062 domain-containing protein [Bermanella marisrubri]EAT13290.1 hypothetical protein RED65_00980 [Oceanobacter sp. RED65] [Bermanella marisrubri]QIZ84053.1 DUF4062 domain-containing protein [Bermanella marisrubri]